MADVRQKGLVGGGYNYVGLVAGQVVECYKSGQVKVETVLGTRGGSAITFATEITVDDPNEYGLPGVGDMVVIGYLAGREDMPVLLGVFRKGHSAEYPLDHVDDEVKRWPAGLRRKVSGEDGTVSISREEEASTIEVEVENDVKITLTSPKKIQVHADNIELGGETAQALVNAAAVAIINAHVHTETGTTTSAPTTQLQVGVHTTKKVKAE